MSALISEIDLYHNAQGNAGTANGFNRGVIYETVIPGRELGAN
jgi:hypothetical protein